MNFFDVRVSTYINRTPEQVWEYVKDVGAHVDWMADAASLEFRSDQREGVGTSYNCVTELGPLKTVDVITITEWIDNKVMGVSHSGVVTGVGRFTLHKEDAGTRFEWFERLKFPLYFGGRIGEAVAAPIFRFVWRRNLKALKSRVEARA